MRVLFIALFAASLLADDKLPIPHFADASRRSRLEAAFPEIDRVFERYTRQRGAPGLVFGIVIDGDLAHVKAFGVRDRSSNDAVTPDTAFRIASMTKSFTALAILKLRDEGKLSLEDPVAKWIPEFARMNYPTRDTAPIRVRQLLTHGAGFPEDNPWGDQQLGIPDDTLTAWLRKGIPFSTPPDTSYEYSNYGFGLLGRIVAKASGVPYRDYLEKQILAPLGMTSSTLEPSTVPVNRRAIGYRRTGEIYSEEPSLAHGAFGSMGGLVTTARDLARYVGFHLSAFPPRDDAEANPVRRSSVREMQAPWRSSGFSANRGASDGPLQVTARAYGYGLGISQDCRFAHIVGHGGGLPGFGSYMMWLPEYGVGMFAMANITYAGPAGPIGEAFDLLRKTGALEKRELRPSPALTSTRDAIVRIWQNWNERDFEAIAAGNLFLDIPAETRRKEIQRIQTDLGPCGSPGDVRPQNLLRGTFRLTCARGFADVTFTLAPTMPPAVQHLSFATTKSLEPGMKTAAAEIAAQFGTPSAERLTALAASPLDVAALQRRIDAVRPAYGGCRAGDPISGDGATSARVRFQCDLGQLDANLRAENGKLTSVSFSAAPGSYCAP